MTAARCPSTIASGQSVFTNTAPHLKSIKSKKRSPVLLSFSFNDILLLRIWLFCLLILKSQHNTPRKKLIINVQNRCQADCLHLYHNICRIEDNTDRASGKKYLTSVRDRKVLLRCLLTRRPRDTQIQPRIITPPHKILERKGQKNKI